MKSEHFSEELLSLNGIDLLVTSYSIESVFYCHISSKDPGATIARASGSSKDIAVAEALRKTKQRLGIAI